MRIDDGGEDAGVGRDGIVCEGLGSGLSELLVGLGMSFNCQ